MMPRTASTVTAIVVSYNVRDLLLACVASLSRADHNGELDEIIVVDNGSDDGSAEAIQKRFEQVRLIQAPNEGYGAGANRGIEAATSDFLLILNADTVVCNGAVWELARYLDCHPDVAVAGPRLRYPDGSIQPSRRRFPARLTPVFESTIIQEVRPRNQWTRVYYMEDRPEDEAQPVDWVVGAAMLVRSAALDRVGVFDTTYRMFAEEVEWCYRFRRHGWSVAYVPSAEIIHHEGASTGQDLPLRQIEFDTSRVELQRRMYGDRCAAALRLALRASYLAYIAREGLKWLIGHRRSLRARRIRLYRRALRSPLRRSGNGDV